jgi:diguanylate cyclase (GGDEF)-like protein
MSSQFPTPTPPPDDEARKRLRRRQRLQMVWAVQASYTVDCALLLGLAWAGGLDASVALVYLGAGTVLGACFHVLLSSGWSERFDDHYLAGPQVLAHALLNLCVMLWAPQIGLLLLAVLFVIFGFGALRVDARQLWSAPTLFAAITLAAVVAVVLVAGERLAMPTATTAQRALCGAWIALNLARSTLIGFYSARLRVLLNQRNAELATAFDKLAVLASRDELTGALNRRSVMRLLEEECQRMQRTGHPFGVALLDIDHFKLVNDRLGHLVGDQALRRFTLCAASHMRTTDRLGRYGGEEFLLLLTATGDVAAACVATERVREGTAAHDWSLVSPGMKLTVSAGVAICEPGESAEHLLHRADVALYAAKRDGRNCTRVG